MYNSNVRGEIATLDAPGLHRETVYDALTRQIEQVRTHLEHLENCKRLLDGQPATLEVLEALRKAGL